MWPRSLSHPFPFFLSLRVCRSLSQRWHTAVVVTTVAAEVVAAAETEAEAEAEAETEAEAEATAGQELT